MINVDSCFSVDIRVLRGARKKVNFDIYIALSEKNLSKVFSADTGIDYKRLAHYIHKGIKELFIHNDDADKYYDFIKLTPEKVLQDEGASSGEKILALMDMTEQNLAEVFLAFEIPEQVAEKSSRIIKNFVVMLAEDPKLLANLVKVSSQSGDYLYYHSISVAIFAMLIAKAAGQLNSKMLEIVALGGLLHDIGMTQVPYKIANAKQDLTPEEWKEMKKHPKYGLRMVEVSPLINDEIRYIIYQHHEEPNGGGYPNGLRGQLIFYPAKIVAVADSFCALITDRPFRKAYNPIQALKIMEKEVGKFDKEILQALHKLLSLKFKNV